jgi:hypothetical protein
MIFVWKIIYIKFAKLFVGWDRINLKEKTLDRINRMGRIINGHDDNE